MRLRSVRSSWLLLALTWVSALHAPALAGASTTGVSLVVGMLLVALLALIVTAAVGRQLLAPAAGSGVPVSGFARPATRQCDPDAAGHVRSRAPNTSVVFAR